jgi:hypothetical protein
VGHVGHVAAAPPQDITKLPQHVDGDVDPDEPQARNADQAVTPAIEPLAPITGPGLIMA